MKKFLSLFSLVFLLLFGLAGCSSNKTDDFILTDDMNLIYEETIYPNEEYAEKQEDIVSYTVNIYQDKDNSILVDSKSNSGFFKPLQYKIDCDTSIKKADINIEWTTAIGNTTATEEDQLCVAVVSISKNGELLDKRKISFINGGIEIVEDTINKNV